MSEIDISLQQLRRTIGADVWHRGVPCRVIEVLDDGPTLVLQGMEQKAMQTNQFGDPRRHVPATYTIPVLDADGGRINPDFQALGLGAILQ